MATKKASKKQVSKKKVARKKVSRKDELDDPPIIVGGGGSEIIKIRADLAVSTMPPAGNYVRYRVAGVNITRVTVDGKPNSVNPSTNSVVFEE